MGRASAVFGVSPSGYSCAERAEKGWQAEQCADAVHGGEETGRGAV